jgi:hypothetical protein
MKLVFNLLIVVLIPCAANAQTVTARQTTQRAVSV